MSIPNNFNELPENIDMEIEFSFQKQEKRHATCYILPNTGSKIAKKKIKTEIINNHKTETEILKESIIKLEQQIAEKDETIKELQYQLEYITQMCNYESSDNCTKSQTFIPNILSNYNERNQKSILCNQYPSYIN